MEHTLLADLVVVYALALGAMLVLGRLRIPPVVALMVTGVLAGPYGLGLFGTSEEVNELAEIGIVLLLFTVGLDFSIGRVQHAWKAVLASGVLQIIGTAVVVWSLLTWGVGVSWRTSALIGVFVALSSTAIVLKELAERNQLDAPHGRFALGILLLQDVAVVVLLLLVPMLAGEVTPDAIPAVLLRAAAALAAVAVASRFALPALLRLVIASRRREAFTLAILMACVGTAWVGSLLGLSLALGAFLGGLMLAESEFSHQAHAEIRPLRDILASLFFISLGMLLDLPAMFDDVGTVLLLALGLIFLKTVVAGGAVLSTGRGPRVAVMAGLGLAQVGEFSFILGRAGLDAGLLDASSWQVLLAASMLTMIATPGLIALSPTVGQWFGRWRPLELAADGSGPAEGLSDHVIVLGYGLGGQLVGEVMRKTGIPYLVMELNGSTVRRARKLGEPVFYGDATNPEGLQAAGIDRARAVAVMLSDPIATKRVVQAIRTAKPEIPVLVRTRYRLEALEMERLGARIAVAEEVETSLEILAQLLAQLGLPLEQIQQLTGAARREAPALRPLQPDRLALEFVPPELGQSPIVKYELKPDQWAAGKTLAEVDLRALTGASVLAIQDGETYIPSPPSNQPLSGGSTLFLIGEEPAIRKARSRLATGE